MPVVVVTRLRLRMRRCWRNPSPQAPEALEQATKADGNLGADAQRHANNRAQLVVIAYETGIVRPGLS